MSEAVLKEFIGTVLGGNARLHAVKMRNGWGKDGKPVQTIVVRIRPGHEAQFTLPQEFQGFAVVRERWTN